MSAARLCRDLRSYLSVLLLAALSAMALFGQSYQGGIRGSLADVSGAVVATAKVTLTAQGTNVTRQGVTKHLEVLAAAGLARSVRHGRERLWQLDRASFDQARRYLDDLSRQWDDALARLKASVET